MDPAVNNIQHTLFGQPFPKITYRRHWSHAVETNKISITWDSAATNVSPNTLHTQKSKMYITSNFEIIYTIRPGKQICSEAIPGIFFFADENYKLFFKLTYFKLMFNFSTFWKCQKTRGLKWDTDAQWVNCYLETNLTL